MSWIKKQYEKGQEWIREHPDEIEKVKKVIEGIEELKKVEEQAGKTKKQAEETVKEIITTAGDVKELGKDVKVATTKSAAIRLGRGLVAVIISYLITGMEADPKMVIFVPVINAVGKLLRDLYGWEWLPF